MFKIQQIRLSEVLVIEDDPIFSRLNAHLVKTSLNAESKLFSDARKAIEYLDDSIPIEGKKLILLDLNMPLMNGWDFLDAIEEKSYKDEILVVIITSSLFIEDKNRSRQYDRVIAYFTKPIKNLEFSEFLKKRNLAYYKLPT